MNPPVRLLARRAYPDHRGAAQAEFTIKRLSCLEKWRWAAACAQNVSSLALSGTD